jgi:hypothetical protein
MYIIMGCVREIISWCSRTDSKQHQFGTLNLHFIFNIFMVHIHHIYIEPVDYAPRGPSVGLSIFHAMLQRVECQPATYDVGSDP